MDGKRDTAGAGRTLVALGGGIAVLGAVILYAFYPGGMPDDLPMVMRGVLYAGLVGIGMVGVGGLLYWAAMPEPDPNAPPVNRWIPADYEWGWIALIGVFAIISIGLLVLVIQ